MKITFLGTSQAIPTKSRNHSAFLVQYEDENILIDCGEGTQRQFRKAGINPCKLTKLLITHWHGDHILGIPGLLQTLALNNYSKTLEVYGPKGTKKFMKKIISMFLFSGKIKLKVNEIEKNGTFYENKLIFKAFKMAHGVPSLAYRIEEKPKLKIKVEKIKKLGIKGHLIGKLQKGENIVFNNKKILSKNITYKKEGKKIAVIMDTSLNDNCYKASKNCNALICESTYMKKDKDKAKEYHHLTSENAAKIAKKSKVKSLYLVHLSQRYEKHENEVLKEAKKIFKNSFLPNDLDYLELK